MLEGPQGSRNPRAVRISKQAPTPGPTFGRKLSPEGRRQRPGSQGTARSPGPHKEREPHMRLEFSSSGRNKK